MSLILIRCPTNVLSLNYYYSKKSLIKKLNGDRNPLFFFVYNASEEGCGMAWPKSYGKNMNTKEGVHLSGEKKCDFINKNITFIMNEKLAILMFV